MDKKETGRAAPKGRVSGRSTLAEVAARAGVVRPCAKRGSTMGAIELMAADPSTIALGAELLGRMLASTPDCDAIFCCNDDLAHGAIYQCQRRGIAVPQQLAICGFNDLLASAWMNPSVTTIATPRYRIGFKAATQVDRGFTLMVRESAQEA